MSWFRMLCRALAIAWMASMFSAAMAYSLPSAVSTAPIASMSPDDFVLARLCLRDALDEAADGIVHFWSNSKTRSSGTVTPIRWFHRDGMQCRDVEITFRAISESTRDVWMLCQAEEGWRFLGPR